jgi:hypothetical protein
VAVSSVVLTQVTSCSSTSSSQARWLVSSVGAPPLACCFAWARKFEPVIFTAVGVVA